MEKLPIFFPMEWQLILKGICTLPLLVDQKFLKWIQGINNDEIIEKNFILTFLFNVFTRQGKILLEIPIPARKVTSVAFGGPNLDILFVTTASIPVSAEAIGLHPSDKKEELAGKLFTVTGLGAKGFPGVKVHV